MTQTQSLRLAQIRAEMAKWAALEDTSSWESVFLLRLLDEKNEQIRNLEKAK